MSPLAVLLAFSAPALAQTTTDAGATSLATTGGFDAHGFRLVSFDADPRDPMRLQRPGDMESGSWYVGGLGEFANRPLVFQTASDPGPVSYLSGVVAANLSAGVVAADPVRFDLSVPFYLASNGVDGSQGASLGDVRLSSLVAFMQPEDTGRYGLGVVAAIDVPTGRPEHFLGDTGVAGLLALANTIEQDEITVTTQVGARLAPNTSPDERPAPTQGGDTLEAAGSVGYLLDDMTGVTLEAEVGVPFSPEVREAIGIGAEATLGVRHVREGGAHVSGGLGFGLGRGAGATPLRVLIGGGFGTASAAPKDSDADGLSDRDDDCVSQPETVNGYRDDDGCPDTLADLVVVAQYDGNEYPEADMVLSSGPTSTSFDFGPVRVFGRFPGEAWEAEATYACMTGTGDIVLAEGDNRLKVDLVPVLDSTVHFVVVDENDEPLDGASLQWVAGPTGCAPDEVASLVAGKASIAVGAGDHEVAGTAEGYGTRLVQFTAEREAEQEIRIQLLPTRVALDDSQIRILEKVHFETNSHIIKSVSHQLLSEVAATIVSHPEFGAVEVEGHADERGPSDYNQQLSARRARAVADYLIKEGVASERLEVTGYGEEKPLVQGSGEPVWSKNRRVQFTILGRRDLSEAP